MSRSLLQFLKESRQIHLRFLSGALGSAKPPIYVVGNPSADLDSIICAIVYAYFAHQRCPTSAPRSHIPLVNLPTIPSGPELCKLRPEFVKALWVATNKPALSEGEKWAETREVAGELLKEHILTVNDFATHLKQHGKENEQINADVTMVDWNAMPIQHKRGVGSLTGLENVRFNVVGFLDHHSDEKFVPHPDTMALRNEFPTIIQSTGSCASFVVTMLDVIKCWQDTEEGKTTPPDEKQLARLALAPILADTANMTAQEKVTGADETAIDFLSSKLDETRFGVFTITGQNEIYAQIMAAKEDSLDLLTLDEILDRDFKQWTEKTTRSDEKVEIGFCSVVKPLHYMIRKAGSPQSFLDALSSFSTSRNLDIVVVMTAFTSMTPSGGKFRRELFICTLGNGSAADILESAFVPEAIHNLNLRNWLPLHPGVDRSEEDNVRAALNTPTPTGDGRWKRLWVQMDTAKSRKQVAPLLRGVVAKY